MTDDPMIDLREQKTTNLATLVRSARDRSPRHPRWLASLKDRAAERFLETGIPTTRIEEWRYTSTTAISGTMFEEVPEETRLGSEVVAAIRALSGHRLVFVDGHHSEQLSSVDALPPGLVLASLAGAISEDDGTIESHLGQHADWESHGFVALNTSLFADGAYVRVPDQAVIEAPIQLVFVSSTGRSPSISNVRNLIVAGTSSRVAIVETWMSEGSRPHFSNGVTEIVAGMNSIVEHYKHQKQSVASFHVATVQIQQDRDSRVHSHSISLGAALARNDINSTLAGEGSSCSFDGLYLASGTQHVDHHTLIDHAKPHCDSQELYKGVLGDSARAVFDGRIVVRKDAQKTNSGQVNKNLLLSESAIVDTKPQLEIYADDVKCTHGSTIGQIDEDSLFYLRSRGIGEEDARALMVYAFASELVGRITVTGLRQELEQILLERLPSQSDPEGS